VYFLQGKERRPKDRGKDEVCEAKRGGSKKGGKENIKKREGNQSTEANHRRELQRICGEKVFATSIMASEMCPQ
jgi:hypothetical protein